MASITLVSNWDADAVMALADARDDDPDPDPAAPAAGLARCPECRGEGEVWDYSPTAGMLSLSCPCCGGDGEVEDADGDALYDDPRVSAPYDLAGGVVSVRAASAAPAGPAPCPTCEGTRCVVKSSTVFAGMTFRAPCPECFPSIPTMAFRRAA